MSLEIIKDVIENGKLNMISDAVNETLTEGVDSGAILDAMIEAMDNVGDRFQNNDIYVPEMLIAAKTMERGVAVLKTSIGSYAGSSLGLVIMGTVEGDLHDIGKNLVSIMLQSVGFEVIDLGIDVPPEDFIKAIKEHPECRIVCLSALLSFTLDSMRKTVYEIKKSNACKNVKIMIGGAPVTASFAADIGADYFTENAADAAKVAREIISLNINNRSE